MGAWGVEPFDNDYSLDAIDELTDKNGVRRLLHNADEDLHEAYAAAEVIAAAAGALWEEPCYQLEGTNLFTNILCVGKATKGNTPHQIYFPPEIAEWISEQRPNFDLDDWHMAYKVIEKALGTLELSSWQDVQKRREALLATRARLQRYEPDATLQMQIDLRSKNSDQSDLPY